MSTAIRSETSPLRSHLDTSSQSYRTNVEAQLRNIAELNEQLELVLAGGGEKYVRRHHERGRLLARERIELLLNRDAHFLELSSLAAWGTEFAIGASVVTGVGVVSGVEVVVIAHDSTVCSGAMNPWSLKKTVHRFEVPDLPGIRVDSGIRSGLTVGVHYDPMLAKVIAHAADREQAVRRLARALSETVVHGVTTNRQLLVSILREPEFHSGAIDTGYLERHDHVAMSRSGNPRTDDVHLIAATLAGAARRRHNATVLPQLTAGWRNVPSCAAWAAFRTEDDAEHRIDYDLRRGVATVDDTDYAVKVHECDANASISASMAYALSCGCAVSTTPNSSTVGWVPRHCSNHDASPTPPGCRSRVRFSPRCIRP
ncbi:carboxyl transferase domain-containing protein [Nocardia aurantiaca]|uniref:Biotin carboxylation domain-containing protein n=1 Tax=Nocardia aurantiaca TaxID=2675850 RepID=A0A6I3L6Z3_9NOCA|nr:carboxyl transferase domain-containing protein [Nocardia aurantiaca]MTE16730.1 hypothetical protein [Nocardia aurantiaca]